MPQDRSTADTQCAASHRTMVERVIQTMHDRLHKPLPLRAMAEVAGLSPYYFCRVFRQVTSVSPGEFLSALRIEAAKRLLLTTTLDVTDICLAVGYTSLGTFSARFAEMVGFSPRSLRRLAATFTLPDPPIAAEQSMVKPLDASYLSGWIRAPDNAERLIFVGLFARPIAQRRPAAAVLLSAPGRYRLGPVADGCYYPYALALPRSADNLTYFSSDNQLLVGCADEPIIQRDGVWYGMANIVLRPPQITDPPFLVALPCLLKEIEH